MGKDPMADIQKIFHPIRGLKRCRGGDAGDESRRHIALWQEDQGGKHRWVQRRLSHPGELDLKLLGLMQPPLRMLANHIVDLGQHLLCGQIAQVFPPGIAHGAGNGAAELGGDYNHPFVPV
jgi:hypothetical protein